jgi:hypothetical protein
MREACDGSHMCEPPQWPSGLGETWACPECGLAHESFRLVDHIERLRIPDFITIPTDSYGWWGRS